MKFSNVTIRETKESKEIKIGSRLPYNILEEVINKWQSLIDTAAKIVDVPSCLIMRLNEKTIEVFLKSQTKGNPYNVGDQEELIYGLYCETVIGTQKRLLISDATKIEIWKENNPDVDLNMISYIGLPVNWPNGNVFGTVCLLDNKENFYSKEIGKLLNQIKNNIEADLQILCLNEDINHKNDQLEKLNNTKDKFFSIIAHDLKSPFNTMLGFSKLLFEEYDKYSDEELKSFFSKVHNKIQSTNKLLDDLLTWAQTQNGGVEFNPKNDCLYIITDEAIKMLTQFTEVKHLNIRSEISEYINVYVDRNMLSTIVRNLISNAIKFTPDGGEIVLKAKEVTNEKSQKFIEVSVIDNGIGIPLNMQSRIFNIEENISTVGTDGEKGTGLGLTICKEFVERHGGKIWVVSDPENKKNGKGSIFSFTLPVFSTKD